MSTPHEAAVVNDKVSLHCRYYSMGMKSWINIEARTKMLYSCTNTHYQLPSMHWEKHDAYIVSHNWCIFLDMLSLKLHSFYVTDLPPCYLYRYILDVSQWVSIVVDAYRVVHVNIQVEYFIFKYIVCKAHQRNINQIEDQMQCTHSKIFEGWKY